MSAASSSASRKAVARSVLCELPPLFSLPLTSCRAAQAAFSLCRAATQRSPSRRHMLVLDIDETLVCTYAAVHASYDKKIMEYKMLLRPHLGDFLAEVETLFDLVFWTAGTASYCSAVISGIQEAMGRVPSKCYAAESILAAAKGDYNSMNIAAAQRLMLKDCLLSSPEKGQAPVWACLSRNQTLQDLDYMKYLPLLGVDLASVVMVDDHERSFPLAPRNGLKIPRFSPNVPSSVLEDPAIRDVMIEKDDTLLRLLPLLRAVARAPDVRLELDHWRPDDYVACDDPKSTLNPLSRTRRTVLGTFLYERRERAIPPLPDYRADDEDVQKIVSRVDRYAAETTARTNESRRMGPLQSHI